MNGIPVCIFRGTTVRFAATFFDINMDVTQPMGAAVNISYLENGQVQTDLVEMTPPVDPDVQWKASWDSREVSPGLVTWSIHTEGDAIPFGVEDGSFELTANNANLPTF